MVVFNFRLLVSEQAVTSYYADTIIQPSVYLNNY